MKGVLNNAIMKKVKNTKGKKVLNEKYSSKEYSSYNQITKEYDVLIISNEQYDKLSEQDKKEVKFVVVRKKTKNLPPDPAKPPVWFSYWVENGFKPEINRLDQKINEVKQDLAKTNARLENIVKKNNLKE